MSNAKSAPPTPRMSDAAVQAKTGKKWSEWFSILDNSGARKMNHREIARFLYERYKVAGWWSQMVAVTYEQARGLRVAHQRPEGYEISVSKTIGTSAASVFRAWQDDETRSSWLPERSLVIHKATPHKSMRITWADGKKSVSVNFYPKGNARSQVVVQHGQLPDAKVAERMKAYWAKALERLKQTLEA